MIYSLQGGAEEMEEKYQVYISYRRDGGQYLARSIRDGLTERGFRVFLMKNLFVQATSIFLF